MRQDQLQEGVLCQLKMGRWDARTRVPKSKLGELPKEIVRAIQDVVTDRSMLDKLATIRRSAKGLLQRNSLPFPIDGVYWVKKEKIPELDERFQEWQKEYKQLVDELCGKLDKMEADFKAKYPDFYDKKHYPNRDRLRSKFYFYWNFFQIDVPGEETKILSPSLYKRETEKLRKMVDHMEEMTMNMIGSALMRRVEKLAKQCESEKINAGTFNSIERFLKKWDDLWKDYVDDNKLRVIMSQLKRQMKGASPERLKGNEDFRQKMGDKLTNLVEKLEAMPDWKIKPSLDI